MREQNNSHTCVSDTAEAHALVDSLKAAGIDMLKMYNLSAPLYFALAAEARRIGLRFGGHSTNVSPLAAADSGASILDHPTQPNISALFDSLCFDPLKATIAGCRPVADRWRQTNTWSVPTLITIASNQGQAKNQPPRSIPRLLARTVRAFFAGAPYDPAWLRQSVPTHASKDSAQSPFPSLRVPMQVGLPIAAGTDWDYGFGLHAELAMLVERGLTPLAALQAATLNPAKMLRASDSLGTVASGKLADLVLLDANPLVDITNTTAIRAVVANGRYYDRAALDRLLATVQANTTDDEKHSMTPLWWVANP